jgi:hypothetical protein
MRVTFLVAAGLGLAALAIAGALCGGGRRHRTAARLVPALLRSR